nr:glycerate kinase [Nocardioides litoris]
MLAGETVPTAMLEMAAAAGLRHVPPGRRDPLETTTRGVGELVAAALDRGARRILVGCGDSGTSDGGAGMAQALGARLLDADGDEIGPGGRELLRLDRIELDGLDPRLAECTLDVACNWTNVLTGPHVQGRAQQGRQPGAQAPGRTRARGGAHVGAGHDLDHVGVVQQGLLQHLDGRLLGALLRAVDPGDAQRGRPGQLGPATLSRTLSDSFSGTGTSRSKLGSRVRAWPSEV